MAARLFLRDVADGSGSVAVERWQAWARDVYVSGVLHGNPKWSAIWQLYMDGNPYSEIIRQTGTGRATINRMLSRVRAAAPRCPVRNPWRKSGRHESPHTRLVDVAEQADPHMTAKLLSLAYQCADQERLRELIAADPELSERLPTGGRFSMAEAKKTGMVTYSRIILKVGETWQVPGGAMTGKNAFMNVEGRPHAGGIEVTLEAGDPRWGSRPETVAITLPWWKIAQAERVMEDA